MYINNDIIRAIQPSSLKCQPFLISKSSLRHQQKKTWPIHWVSSLKLTAATSAKIFNWGFVYIAAVCCLVSCSIRKEWPRLLRERAPLFKKIAESLLKNNTVNFLIGQKWCKGSQYRNYLVSR